VSGSGSAGGLPADGTAVVVGASLAGLRAAETLRAEGHRGSVVLVGEELHLPYERPPLSKQVLAGSWPPERAMLADQRRLSELEIHHRPGQRAVTLDAAGRRVELDDGSVLVADGIVVATGAAPRRLPGTDGHPAVHVLRTLDDALALRRQLVASGPGCRVVVIGAGFIGSEVAATCAGLDCVVSVVEAMPTPLAPALGVAVGAACAAMHERHGVALHVGVGVRAVHPLDPDGTTRVELDDGTILPADVVVVGIGVLPATDWLEGSGLTVANGVLCDAALFAADGVVAAGDVARWPHPAYGEVRIEHWEVAAQQGVAAARSLLAGRQAAVPFGDVPYFWSDLYGLRIQVLGHPSPDDEVTVVTGTLDDERFVALYGREGRLRAAMAISMPRQLMAYRPLLVAGSSLAEARALTAG
jgi:NADPH-dependent 2,4-dienoyl-CoA reductase/sulfur reductase-like enzyme